MRAADNDPRRNAQVSFDDEPLIVVDADDNVLGYKSKVACHVGEGILHRAFSVFLFDGRGNVLLHQRAAEKPLWGLYWSNSCCSHPRRGETVDEAAVRRVREELGLETALEFLYRFQYHAPFGEKGSERELCSVYVGRVSEDPTVNETEIADWAWVDAETLADDLDARADRYTPWFKMEWKRLREEFWERVAPYANG